MPRQVIRASSDAFATLGTDQEGVLSRIQLVELGWSHDQVASAIEAARWTAYGPQAIVLHRGPLTTRQRRWVAVLNGGPTATLAGLTALSEYGFTGFDTETVHIVVKHDEWVPRAHDGVKVHVSRRFEVSDRHPARLLPTVRCARAVIDSATWSARPRRASAIVIASVQQRLVTPVHLRSELALAGYVRHRKLLAHVIDDVEGGVHALSELDFVRLARRFRLPRPELQEKRIDQSGRTRYLDVRFRRPDGRVLNLEIDGAAHFGVVEAWADMDRDIAFLARGEPTVRLPSTVVRFDPAGVATRISQLLQAPW